MRRSYPILIWLSVLLGFVVVACAPPGPPISEVLQSFETLANEKDVEGTMALFARNAVVEESYRGLVFDTPEEIASLWRSYYRMSPPAEFRDISIDGDTATFIWADVSSMSTSLWPVVIEVKNGKITYMDYYENSTLELPGDS
jgi:hypothetical protein